MLHEWLHRPHVRKWWNEPSSLEELRHDYLLPVLDESSTRAYIAILEGNPIGFIQSYVVKASGDGWWENELIQGRAESISFSRMRINSARASEVP